MIASSPVGDPASNTGLFSLQMAGTFPALAIEPDVAFQGGEPLLFTTGEEPFWDRR